MKRIEFKEWMVTVGRQDESSANARIAGCERVERAFGDLDLQYQADGLQAAINQLKYTAADQRANKSAPAGLPIDGNISNGLATLKSSVKKYREFCEHQEDDMIEQGDNSVLSTHQVAPVDTTTSVVITPSISPIATFSLTVHTNSENSILLLPVHALQRLHFTIGNYQRGYKWGKKEVLELLNDIHCHKPELGIYCLQPLIVKPLGNERSTVNAAGVEHEIHSRSEIIDGQQRTTTLFLLLSYLKHIGKLPNYELYDLAFNTRARSGEFLSSMLPVLFNTDVSSILDADATADYENTKVIDQLWQRFAATHKQFDNVDVYHFFVVASYLRRWCELHLAETKACSEFCDKLLTNVQLIWYSLDSASLGDEIIVVFLNNNKGKIKLTSSELIKALFVLTIRKQEAQTAAETHINRFAMEWDAVEKKLHDDAFWYFLQPREDAYTDGTRIDFLFDLHLKKGNNRDPLFAYRTYERKFNADELNFEKEWGAVITLFNKLVDWYNDSEIYHYQGFVINTGIKDLDAILSASKGKTKAKLRVWLIDQIKDRFRAKDQDASGKAYHVYDPEHLHYLNSPSECRQVLLLHNVEYHVNNMAKHKFPFELFVKENWSIEHIIPQHPKAIEDFGRYKEWFEEQIEFQEESEENKSVVDRLKTLSSFEELKKDSVLKTAVDELITRFEVATHAIGNLLLLDRNTNSALQNEPFSRKRAKILLFDRTGENQKGKPVFIPRETLNAFNKTFAGDVQYQHWTGKDSIDYTTSIRERLATFLPQLKSSHDSTIILATN